MKNSADLGGCYPPRPLASVDNTLLYLQNSSYPTQPHSIIAKYVFPCFLSHAVNRFGELIRKIWNPRNFKAHVSPHEMLQVNIENG